MARFAGAAAEAKDQSLQGAPADRVFWVPALRAVTKTNTGVAVLIAAEQRPRAAYLGLEEPCIRGLRARLVALYSNLIVLTFTNGPDASRCVRT